MAINTHFSEWILRNKWNLLKIRIDQCHWFAELEYFVIVFLKYFLILITWNVSLIVILLCFRCWDTAGQERFKALRTPFYRGSDICLLTYAVNDRDSFRGLKHWREEFIKYADVDGDSFPFIVVGNKVSKMINETTVWIFFCDVWKFFIWCSEIIIVFMCKSKVVNVKFI